MKYTNYNFTEHFQTLIKFCTNLQQNIWPDRIVKNLLQLTWEEKFTFALIQ
jgi:hypothetical protein